VNARSDETEFQEAPPKSARAQSTPGAQAADLLHQLLQSATDAIWFRDPDGRFQIANAAAASIMGLPPADVIGRTLDEIWGPGVGRKLHEQSEALFRSGKPLSVEEDMFDAGVGTTRTFLSNKVPLFAPDGRRIGILGISRDITDRKQVEDDLRESEARLGAQVEELNALYDSAPIGLAFFSRDYRYLRINSELAAINGIAVDDHLGRTIREVLSDSAPMVEPIIDRVFETGEAVRDLEVSGETPQQPGVERHWLTGFYPVKGEDGQVQAVGAWVIEISERKAAAQREVLLAREVDHRAKNLLAVVQSIVQLTPALDPDELKTSIVGRIQALARAHSLLSDSRWDGVDLKALVQEELAPFAPPGSQRISHDGPSLTLRPAAAQSLALVLHELATNAAKYGALSNEAGKLEVRWSRTVEDQKPILEIRWEESGGPPVQKPAALSFGSNIIRASVERQLRGRVIKDWRVEGLLCTLRIPSVEVAPAVRSEG
jgi:PAS domain S-box-containing protein